MRKKECNHRQWSRPISVTMPPDLLEYLDEICDINCRSRSEMIRILLEEKRREDINDAE